MTASLLEQHGHTLLATFASLSEGEWAQPSLCEGWTNHDVLAHLVIGCRFPLGRLVWTMAATHSPFDEVNDRLTKELSATTPADELLDEFSDHVTRLQTLTRLLFPARLMLGDHLTHHLDVVLPLGRHPEIPARALEKILRTQVSLPNPFVPARRRAQELRIEAADLDWQHGPARSPVVRGKATHLISSLAGRPFALPHLDGDGVQLLHDRIAREG